MDLYKVVDNFGNTIAGPGLPYDQAQQIANGSPMYHVERA